jgi:hypothetical protein
MSRLTVVHTLVPLASRTATCGNISVAVNVADYREGSLHLLVTAKGGTNPRLRPVWQQSHDGVSWADHTALPTFSNTTSVKVLPLSILGQYGRVRCTAGGTAGSVSYAAYFTGKW